MGYVLIMLAGVLYILKYNPEIVDNHIVHWWRDFWK